MQAAEWFEQEIKPPSEVARRLRVSVKSASHWHQLWRAGGRESLASRAACPRAAWRNWLRTSMRALAAHGWVEDQVWTASRVATLIGRKFHVSYSVSGATRLIHRLGFSPQVPAAGRQARRAGRDRVEGGDLGGGKWARAACGGYICFEDEAGFTRRPPKRRTWAGAVTPRS